MMIIAVFCLSASLPALAQASPPARDIEAVQRFAAFIDEASRRFGVPASWVRLVLQAESAGNANAVSAKGAMGLMQIMPETYARLRRSYGLDADPFQPRDNIMAGAAYLREMVDRFGVPGFLAAYNAGPGRYEDHLATGQPLPEETRLYLARLAPLVAGVQADRIAMASDPLIWTQAPLFMIRAGDNGRERNNGALGDVYPSSTRPALAEVTGLAPRSDGLFVRIISGAGPQ